MKKREINSSFSTILTKIIQYSRGVSDQSYGEISHDIKDICFKASDGLSEYAQIKVDSLMETLDKIEEMNNDKVYFDRYIQKSKYSILIARHMYDKDSMTHKDLTEFIGKTPAYTSKITKKLEVLNIIRSSKVGKFKYFSLTRLGRQLCEYYTQVPTALPRKLRVKNPKSLKEQGSIYSKIEQKGFVLHR